MDISIYKPSMTASAKILHYYMNNSNVNIKAIKNPVKLLSYYWAAREIGWGDLVDRIRDLFYPLDHEYEIIEEINKQIPFHHHAVDRGCEGFINNFQQLVKKLNDEGIKWTATKRTPDRYEMERDRRDGRCWTLAYTLEATNSHGIQRQFKLARHTSEACDGRDFGFALDGIDYPLRDIINKVIGTLKP